MPDRELMIKSTFTAGTLPAPTWNSAMLYQAYQAHADMMWLSRTFASTAAPIFNLSRFWPVESRAMQRLAASFEIFGIAQLTHKRPPFAIESVHSDGQQRVIHERVLHSTPFGSLLHFSKDNGHNQPKVLLVAPMSGHFATLLRETVRTMLMDHDVYITDWHNARDVSLTAGPFGLDQYTDHIIEFLTVMGPGSQLMAICQPCVSALAAVAVMSEDDHPATPSRLVLMAGPIDCRINPSEVNKLAITQPMPWFEKHLISSVPMRHQGRMRRVYPGFMQVTAFMNMNMDRHIDTFNTLYDHLVEGDQDQAGPKRRFYEEFFAVCDMPGEFFLETVRHVFQEFALPRGRLTWHDRVIRPEAITRTSLLTIEGERDDVCGLGQTHAAQTLCSGLKPAQRKHHVQPDVGHFGTFNGRHWNNDVYPIVRDMLRQD